MNHRRNLLIIALALVSGLLFAAFAAAQTGSSDAENLLGSWNTQGTVVIQDATFPALLTFDAGGGMITDEPPAPGETSGHGNWMMTDEGEVAFTFIALYSEGGAYSGKIKVVGILAYDSATHTWSGPFKIDGYDANDTVNFSDTGTFDLTRIEVESLD